MTDCYCDDGDGPAAVYQPSDVRSARKVYACTECNRAILPGESYERVYGIWPNIDGPEVLRTCAYCAALRDWVEAHVPCLCKMHGYLIEGCKEAVEEHEREAPELRAEFDAMLAELMARPFPPGSPYHHDRRPEENTRT